MKRKFKTVQGKIVSVSVRGHACKKAKCFKPFSGNGQWICRLYELGKCPTKSKLEEEK